MSHNTTSLVRHLQAPIGSTAGAAQSQLGNHFSYWTDDAAATVEAAGYFNASVVKLVKGATIDAVMACSGTPVRKSYVVTANTGTVVTVALQTTTAG